MKENSLLKKLDLEHPDEFRFYENFADLIEHDEDLEEEEVFYLFENSNKEEVGDIISSYLDDLIEFFESEGEELCVTLELISNNLLRLFQEEDSMREFSEELLKFKEWLAVSENVEREEIETGECTYITLIDAISTMKLQHMGTTKYRFDFSNCSDYEVDEYVLPLDIYNGSEVFENEENYDEDDEEEYDYR